MKITRPVLIAIVTALLSILLPASARAATATEVESALAVKINQGRSAQGRSALTTHSGLQGIAGDWSAQMAATNNFTHGNAAGRIDDAAPDPAEANGAPDDGFTGWCENIAWNSLAQSSSANQVAQMFYDQWFNSSGHKQCMLSLSPKNFGQNVMGVGIVYDSADGRWWATLDVAKDDTPPLTWTRYQQNSTAVTYSGTWSSNISHSSASGGSFRKSGTTGSIARFNFNGTGVRWIGERTPTSGIAEVLIDGVVVRSVVDTYASNTQWQVVLFERTGLARRAHSIEIRVKGTKNTSSGGKYVYADAFEKRS